MIPRKNKVIPEILPVGRLTTPLTVSATVFTVAALTACSTGSSPTPSTTAAVSASPDTAGTALPAGVTPASLILDGSTTLDGFTYTPPDAENLDALTDLFSDDDDSEDTTDPVVIDPPHCAGLIVDAATMMSWYSKPSETTTTASFEESSGDNSIEVMVTTVPVDRSAYPADSSECSTFTSTRTSALGPSVQTFHAEPLDIAVDGVEVLTTGKVTTESTTIDGESFDVGAAGEVINLVTATARGVTFTIAALDPVPTEQLSALATAQAGRILNA